MTNLQSRPERLDFEVQKQVAAYVFSLAQGRTVLAADALWRLASHLDVITNETALSPAQLDQLESIVREKGYPNFEVDRRRYAPC
jgi:hypothetical protein